MNPARGEAALVVGGATLVLRPSFAALVAAEQEVGPLFALVERAADGRLGLGEMVALFWHCLKEPGAIGREEFAEGVAAGGLAAATPALKILIGQILAGAVMFAEAAGRLAGVAGVAFGWMPGVFWDATPAELGALVTALTGEAAAPADGAMLARLKELFPDG